jgi:hypothetical protein
LTNTIEFVGAIPSFQSVVAVATGQQGH